MMSDTPPSLSPIDSGPSVPADETLTQSLRARNSDRMVFGQFRLVRELGTGGMAVVWLARDERLGMEVALKFLPGMIASDPEALHDLRREITRGLQITHPGIVRVYYLHEDSAEGIAAISMEYIAGATLADEKRRQPEHCFEVAEPLISWMRTLCEALAYVHEEAKVVHRDLKPRNLMLTAEGKLKITDFGIAAALCDSHSRVTQNPGSSGTPVYMSPQQAAGFQPRAADDIYALGATIYELLTSKPPFFRGSMAVILNQVSSIVPPRMAERREELGITGRAEIPVEWEETVAACLAKEPADRPRSVREVAEKLGLFPARDLESTAATTRRSKVGSSSSAPVANKKGGESFVPPVPRSIAPPLVAGQPKQTSVRKVRRFWLSLVAALGVLGFLFWAGTTFGPLRFSDDHRTGFSAAHESPTRPPGEEPLSPEEIRNSSRPDATATTLPVATAVEEEILSASRDHPWMNSIGMKFVRVGIAGGPTGGRPVLFSIWDTRVQDYDLFIKETHTTHSAPNFEQTAKHPVVNVSWDEAVKFCDWLTEYDRLNGALPVGWRYRLPSDHEWSCAIGIGAKESATALPMNKSYVVLGYPWGQNFADLPMNFGNYADGLKRDKWEYTSPVGEFPPNRLGLFDMGGNVWQWCSDLFNPTDDNGRRVVRGAGWSNQEEFFLRSSSRNGNPPSDRYPFYGFRCVLSRIDASGTPYQ